ncbi:MAG: hypothetical protein HW421_3619 [Ignavibacteria bacterium]|nr:hypothetical protein [Ignavibacteria bacterium]
MNVTSIRQNPTVPIELMPFAKAETMNKTSQGSFSQGDVKPASASWQKEILLQALDMLENTRQLDDSHPLDRFNAGPIENYDQAIIELSFTKTPAFKENFGLAQANLKAEDVLALFTGD